MACVRSTGVRFARIHQRRGFQWFDASRRFHVAYQGLLMLLFLLCLSVYRLRGESVSDTWFALPCFAALPRSTPTSSSGADAALDRRRLLVVWTASLAGASATRIADAAEGDFGGKVNAIDIINIFGRLAGSSCFGKDAPEGTCCQLTWPDFDAHVFRGEAAVSKAQFVDALRSLPTHWPLKANRANPKYTAVAERLAEQRVLRDAMAMRVQIPMVNLPQQARRREVLKLMDGDGVPEIAANLLFARLCSESGCFEGTLSREQVSQMFGTLKAGAFDWDSFLDFFDRRRVMWPIEVADR